MILFASWNLADRLLVVAFGIFILIPITLIVKMIGNGQRVNAEV